MNTGKRFHGSLWIAVLALAFPLTACALAADDAAYAKELARQINGYRDGKRLSTLKRSDTLDALAREHSATMARVGRLDHKDFPSRVRRSGFAMCVENVGWNYRSPGGQFDAWRASPGHERNMAAPTVEAMGIGIVDDYVTMIGCGK